MRTEFIRWVEFFLSTPVRVLHGQEKQAFTRLTLVDAGLETVPEHISTEIKSMFGYQVLEKRAEFIGLKLTDAVKFFLSVICNSPGEIVMYLYVLRAKGVEYNMGRLAVLFPNGFPVDSALSECWDRQKIGGANMLDLLDLNTCFGEQS